MNAEPQKEHQWLQKLVGKWTVEGECIMGPDQPPSKHTGTESVRSIGGLWTMGEGLGAGPDGGQMTSIMTLGYDPQTKRFVGTFIASMMTHLWIYNGTLDMDAIHDGPLPPPEVTWLDVVTIGIEPQRHKGHKEFTGGRRGSRETCVRFFSAISASSSSRDFFRCALRVFVVQN